MMAFRSFSKLQSHMTELRSSGEQGELSLAAQTFPPSPSGGGGKRITD